MLDVTNSSSLLYWLQFSILKKYLVFLLEIKYVKSKYEKILLNVSSRIISVVKIEFKLKYIFIC